MDKLQMAHEYMLSMIEAGCSDGPDLLARSWSYADAMQAEAEKREPKGLPEALCEEWQPDWSQAPEWAKWWAMDDDSAANWLSDHPSSDPLKIKVWTAPTFNFQGNWQNSLRKRPQ